MTAIHSVALTNVPAINGMFAMCADNDGTLDELFNEIEKEDKDMDLKEIAKLLGLPEDATEEQVRTALAGVAAKMKEGSAEQEVVANSTILGLLELPDEARTEDVTAKIMALKAGDATLAQRVQDLEGQIKGKAADDAVAAALKDGKIAAAQKEWARSYALKDPEGFKAFVEQAPAMVPQGRMALKDAPEGKDPDGNQKLILKNLGISDEDFEKYADKEGE